MTRLLLLLTLLVAGLARAGELHVIAYHDVRPDVAAVDDDAYAISRENLARHFAWLKENGYRAVSVDDVIAAREGRHSLPEKAVLLTFDDGDRSLYTEVFPLLKLYNYPAVAALVTSWMEVPAGAVVDYATEMRPRERFISWSEAREMQASGLVEFASQSHDLHYDDSVTPQGTLLPAAANRLWSKESGYESLAAYYQRVKDDLAQSRDILARRLGRAPRVLVWPYGAFSNVGWHAAQGSGFSVSMTLDDTRPATPAATHLGRRLVVGNPDAAALAGDLLPAPAPSPLRTLAVSLDAVVDADAALQQRRLDAVVERVRALGVNTVYLQAVSDTDGDGRADAAYFPNRRLPVRADLFGYLAWQLHSRAGVDVFAALPVTAFRFSAGQDESVAVREVYDDLGRHAFVDGLLFAQAPTAATADAELARALAAVLRAHRPEVRTARTLPAESLAELPALAQAHDHVVLELAACASRRTCRQLDEVAATVRGGSVATDHVVLQLRPAGAGRAADRALADSLGRLQAAGLVSFGYAPDDALRDQPQAARVAPALSNAAFPWGQ
jgi:biofilm PGA synthesis lipoprotein PgaB